jgi:hypothetical protein
MLLSQPTDRPITKTERVTRCGLASNAIAIPVRISEPDEVQCRFYYIVNPKGDGALYVLKDMLCILPI